MNTPAHLIFGMTAFGKPGNVAVTTAALFGALIPDLSLYLLAGTHIFILGTSPEIVFRELYYSDAWQSIFRIDNSFVVWGLLLIAAIGLKSRVFIALTGAAILHLLLDFPLHHDDGRAHFWPVSTWIFESPVSYWDRNHYGGVVGVLEVIASLICCAYLWRVFKESAVRVLIVILGAAEFVPNIMFRMMF